MMHENERQLKGIFLMVTGAMFLFYTMGLLKQELIVFVIAIFLILLGLVKFGGIDKITSLFKK